MKNLIMFVAATVAVSLIGGVACAKEDNDSNHCKVALDSKQKEGVEKAAEATTQMNEYVLGPLSQVQPGVPCGSLTKYTFMSEIFPGSVRDYWLYVPAQYDAASPACVMVFQDGKEYIAEDNAPIVMDNLIHGKKMPVTIAIFINPGTIPNTPPTPRYEDSQRCIEYDTVSGRYASFLMEEILPEVAKKYNLRTDAAGRGICGSSSGGICAFTVAWERPDAFSKVLSFVGSFADIRGGHVYPTLIRKTEKKPIRVFLQDGSNDLDNIWGNWPLANQEMAAALKFKGYDYKFVYGTGGHDHKHIAAILPESLEWLWR
jgi:enterochelin esterase family protein